ncbi:MAG TPA: hypothetical protein VG605_08925 [Puia sp.]|nr:hypothetical protein [Puia sp.]
MSIYDVDFSKAGPQLLPPDKRKPRLVALVAAFLSALQWLRDLWFTSFRTGPTAQNWLSTTTYAKYDQVVYGIYVYMSLRDNNTDVPTTAQSWIMVLSNFIGMSERILYNCQTLVLTYALNKRFMTTFRQPPNVSDIYIGTFAKPVSVFVVGGIEANSSKVYTSGSSEYVIDAYSFADYVNMTIYVPVAVYDSLDPVDANRQIIIRSFADKYMAAGIIYTITTY